MGNKEEARLAREESDRLLIQKPNIDSVKSKVVEVVITPEIVIKKENKIKGKGK